MTDQIHFCCIASGSPFERTNQYPRQVPQAEVDDAINMVLQKVSRVDHRRTLTHKNNIDIHYKISKGVCFMCVSDSRFKKRICFGLLDDMEQNWHKGAIKGSKGDRVLKERLAFFNDTRNDKLTLLNERVDELKDVLVDDIDKVMERGDRLENLVSSTDELAQSGRIFQRGATSVKRATMWKLIILVIMIIVIAIVVIAVIILIIVAAVCSGFNCKKKK